MFTSTGFGHFSSNYFNAENPCEVFANKTKLFREKRLVLNLQNNNTNNFWHSRPRNIFFHRDMKKSIKLKPCQNIAILFSTNSKKNSH